MAVAPDLPTPPHPPAECPACGSTRTEMVLHWPDVPCNSALFLETAEEARSFPRGSFRLTVCRACGFLFNADFDPRLPEYSERNLESQLWSSEFRRYADELAQGWIERFRLQGAHVLEVGAGRTAGFLRAFCDLSGGTGVGFDPVSDAKGTEVVRLVPDLFDDRHLDEPADALICRHTLEHIPNVAEFLGTVRRWGDRHRDAVLLFEVPDTERILNDDAFWDLYYEHCSYFTADTLAATFERHGFEVLGCSLGFGGQYLLLEARPAPEGRQMARKVDAEDVVVQARRFADRHELVRSSCRQRFAAFAAEGPVLVWQASSKALAMIAVLGIARLVAGLVDVNPGKWGRFMVGSGHRIFGPDDVRSLAPRHIVIMNAAYGREIAAMLRERAVDVELHSVDSLLDGADDPDLVPDLASGDS